MESQGRWIWVPWEQPDVLTSRRADIAERKLAAIKREALDAPLIEDTARLRGFILGITASMGKPFTGLGLRR